MSQPSLLTSPCGGGPLNVASLGYCVTNPYVGSLNCDQPGVAGLVITVGLLGA